MKICLFSGTQMTTKLVCRQSATTQQQRVGLCLCICPHCLWAHNMCGFHATTLIFARACTAKMRNL